MLLAERDRLGGECLWTGCAPSKARLRAAQVQAVREAGVYELPPASGLVDLAHAMTAVKRVIEAIETRDSPGALAADGVEAAFGEASFTGPRVVRIAAREAGSRHALIATDSSPALSVFPGLADAAPLTSDSVWDLKELPERLTVLGGGLAGCELGQAIARLGSCAPSRPAPARSIPRASWLFTLQKSSFGEAAQPRLGKT